ncbi:MAG: hypothetical protein QOG10_5094 [Kribbellaceae bacterium]|jgi:hypothetical protein|nr:hypothetical protein [Kribbellaceae bacterium]
MRKIQLASIPTPSTAITEEATLSVSDGVATIAFEFDRDGEIYGCKLSFARVRAYRYRAESHTKLWHIEDAYDTVVEVEDSEWVSELADAEPAGHWGNFETHHFMIYLDSWGSLEVVSKSWNLAPEARIG